jgi:hypothetical protein
MNKLLLVAVISVVTLGTAVSETVRVEAPATSPASSSVSHDVSTRATEQVVSMWTAQAKSHSSGHLARPL